MAYNAQPCIETIRCYHRKLENLAYHQARFDRTRKAFWPNAPEISLEELLLSIPTYVTNELYKCRIVYQEEVIQIDWEPYHKRTIQKLALVTDDSIQYTFKTLDRQQLQTLFTQRGAADDILIIRNGLVTDSYVCNVAFYNGLQWETPVTPLLEGTQRAYLLQAGIISLAPIRANALHHYSHIRLFNAMMPWDEAIDLKMTEAFQ